MLKYCTSKNAYCLNRGCGKNLSKCKQLQPNFCQTECLTPDQKNLCSNHTCLHTVFPSEKTFQNKTMETPKGAAPIVYLYLYSLVTQKGGLL
jgi:hypothetical protein